MDGSQKSMCQWGTGTTFSSGTPRILGYLTYNPYAAYVEMVQKKTPEIMDKTDGC